MLPSLVPKADTDAIVLIFGYNVRERRIFHVEFVFLRNRIDNRGMPTLKEFEAARAQQKEIGKKVAAAPDLAAQEVEALGCRPRAVTVS